MDGRTGRVVVIGAGLAGLGAAWRLSRLGFDVRVLDRAARAGGRALGDSVEGFRFEPPAPLVGRRSRAARGWTSRLARRISARLVARSLGAWAIDPPVSSGSRRSGVRRLQAARLVRLPRLLARYQPQLDPDAPERAAPLDDRSLHDFGRLYFGESVVERWMAPLVGPLGDSPDTSRALFLRRYPAHAESLLGLPRATLSEIVDAAAARLTILTGVEVNAIERLPAGGLRVQARERGRERSFDVDAVLVATRRPGGMTDAVPAPPSA
jgi:phytoene dehydrogenase-like protein